MFLVALTQVHVNSDAEVAAISEIVGASILEVRLWINAVMPRVVFRSESSEQAFTVGAKLRARGHGVVVCDAADAPSMSKFLRAHRVRFDETAFTPHDGAKDRIPYQDIEILLLLTLRSEVVRVGHELVVVNHGARAPHTEQRETSHTEHARGRMIIVYSKSARPCVLQEGELQYLGLGKAMRSTSHENFSITLATLRERAPGAVFDDRFHRTVLNSVDLGVVREHEPAKVARDGGRQVDFALHVLTLWLRSLGGTPYRDVPPVS